MQFLRGSGSVAWSNEGVVSTASSHGIEKARSSKFNSLLEKFCSRARSN